MGVQPTSTLVVAELLVNILLYISLSGQFLLIQAFETIILFNSVGHQNLFSKYKYIVGISLELNLTNGFLF